MSSRIQALLDAIDWDHPRYKVVKTVAVRESPPPTPPPLINHPLYQRAQYMRSQKMKWDGIAEVFRGEGLKTDKGNEWTGERLQSWTQGLLRGHK